MGIPEICDDFDYNPCKSLGCLYAPDAPGNVIKCAGCVDACPADIPEICAPGGLCIENKCPPYYSEDPGGGVCFPPFQSCADTCASYKCPPFVEEGDLSECPSGAAAACSELCEPYKLCEPICMSPPPFPPQKELMYDPHRYDPNRHFH